MQSSIAFISGEAEYYDMAKSTSQGLGTNAMSKYIKGGEARILLSADASAAKSIPSRRDMGDAMHMETRQL